MKDAWGVMVRIRRWRRMRRRARDPVPASAACLVISSSFHIIVAEYTKIWYKFQSVT